MTIEEKTEVVMCPSCGLDWDNIKCEFCGWDGSIEDVVERLDEIENLKFRALDAEVRNHQQGIRLGEFQMKELNRNYNAQVAKLDFEIKALRAAYKTDHAEYVALVTKIAESRGLDATKVSIDPVTSIIRDLRE